MTPRDVVAREQWLAAAATNPRERWPPTRRVGSPLRYRRRTDGRSGN